MAVDSGRYLNCGVGQKTKGSVTDNFLVLHGHIPQYGALQLMACIHWGS